MFKLIEDNSKNELKDKFPNAEKYYKFAMDNQIIGNASINNDINNKFYIYINEDLRGKGYGKMLYSEIINLVELSEFLI